MTAEDVQALARQVKHNCDVSDAVFGRQFSMCGLLLRLRNLFKAENDLPPWGEPDTGVMLAWVARREELWEGLEGSGFAPLHLDGTRIDPFDAAVVNRRLIPAGWAYAAGYGPFLKPTFVLGELADHRAADGLEFLVLGRELARDLSFSPAMRQENLVIGRAGAMPYLFWDRLCEPGRTVARYMAAGLTCCGLDPEAVRARPADFEAAVKDVCRAETETFLAHERGEALDRTLDPDRWREAIAAHPGTEIELVARTLKDVLADTHAQGLLGHVEAVRRPASLLFYLAFIPVLNRLLMPEVTAAGETFLDRPDWEALAQARRRVRRRAQNSARWLFDLIEAGRDRDPDWTRQQVHDRMVAPLGPCGLSPDAATP
jgi:hypothetical protein